MILEVIIPYMSIIHKRQRMIQGIVLHEREIERNLELVFRGSIYSYISQYVAPLGMFLSECLWNDFSK